MQPHEERVVLEKQELDDKLAKLKSFCFGSEITVNSVFKNLPAEDRDLLEDQYTTMEQYSKILGKRIERFPKGN